MGAMLQLQNLLKQPNTNQYKRPSQLISRFFSLFIIFFV